MSDDLDMRIREAAANYAALSPVDRAIHDAEQRRSFVRGQTGADPGPDVLATEVARLTAELAEARGEVVRLRALVSSPWDDKPLPEDAAILAAHPMNDRSPEAAVRYGEAMRLVGARRGKAALVELVAWLLARAALEPKP